MRREFKKATKEDINFVVYILKKEFKKAPWVDSVGVRSWCMDEFNKLGVKWWGKENANLIPETVKKIML